jgi:hypothetical protein
MKYFLKKIKLKSGFLPHEIVNEIYSFINQLQNITTLKKIWYKRLITDDYYHYPDCLKIRCLAHEQTKLDILIKNNAYEIIYNIHNHNLS